MLDVFKIVGVNGTVIGVVTLTDFELILKVTLLVVTIVWTIGKATNEWQTWHRRQRQRKKN
jgi:energy-converting hydrogenase Eha subunit H